MKMIFATIPRLFDMCATSIVYKLWTCQDIYENWNDDDHWQLLERNVSSDVENLPLPDLVQPYILPIVKPAGRHYFSFLHVFLKKLVTSEKWLTRDMLFDTLTLHPVGIINKRKTAEKLLRSKMLNNVIAFRIACINYFEVEILRLWPYVFQYFLNKIIIEHQKIIGRTLLNIQNPIFNLPTDLEFLFPNCDATHGYVKESHEVLFWIGYCLSKETGNSLNSVPHYSQPINGWFQFASDRAFDSGDNLFFEYLTNSNEQYFDWNHENEKHCSLLTSNYLIAFFYHFSSLKPDKKVELFQKYPAKFASYFLQWPLSSLFLDTLNDHQEIYDTFLQMGLLDLLFVTILEILHGVSYLDNRQPSNLDHKPSKLEVSDIYCVDHLEKIWFALWKVCSAETKARIIDSFVFTESFNDFLAKASHKMNFNSSLLKLSLQELFRLQGKAFLVFVESENIQDGLDKVISKYMPEKNLHFQLCELPKYFIYINYLILSYRGFASGRGYASGRKTIPTEPVISVLNLPGHLWRPTEMVVRQTKRFYFPEIKNVVQPGFIHFIHKFLL